LITLGVKPVVWLRSVVGWGFPAGACVSDRSQSASIEGFGPLMDARDVAGSLEVKSVWKFDAGT
jgi:hypothetical protein